MAYDTILVEKRDHVLLITLNRTSALNALNAQMMGEIATALAEADNDPRIGATVITGTERAFAAGAGIMCTLPDMGSGEGYPAMVDYY